MKYISTFLKKKSGSPSEKSNLSLFQFFQLLLTWFNGAAPFGQKTFGQKTFGQKHLAERHLAKRHLVKKHFIKKTILTSLNQIYY